MTSVTESRRAPVVASIVVIAIIICLVLAVLIAPTRDRETLSPNSVAPDGTGALASILKSEGVDVTFLRSWEELEERSSSSTTVVIPSRQARYADADSVQALTQSAHRIVIIGEKWGHLDLYAWNLQGQITPVQESRMRADCPVDDARVAGGIGPVTQVFDTDLAGCFAHADGVGWVPAASGVTELIADASILTNHKLANPGNSAFALRRLGSTDEVLWLSVNATQTVHEGEVVATNPLTPEWYGAATLALVMVFGWLVLYRGRRFGKLVAEPMPVVVPADEADRGRARLYQNGRNVEHAAQAIRAGTISRLSAATGLRKTATRLETVDAITTASGAAPEAVDELFYTRPITSETDLITLASDLDQFLKETHS